MSKLTEAFSVIEQEMTKKDRALSAALVSADHSVRTLYELRLYIETEQKRKKPADQIITDVLSKLIPLTPDGPTK